MDPDAKLLILTQRFRTGNPEDVTGNPFLQLFEFIYPGDNAIDTHR